MCTKAKLGMCDCKTVEGGKRGAGGKEGGREKKGGGGIDHVIIM